MLRLVKPLGESNGLHWMQLRAAVDTALAKCVPIGWLPSVLKTFDLESACRVINEVDDLTVELKPLVLKGPSMLAKAWYDPSGEHQPCLHGEWTRWLDDFVGGRTGVGAGGRRLNGRFRLEVATVKPDESKAQKARELVEQVTSLVEQHPESEGMLTQTLADAREQLQASQKKSLRCHLIVDGPTVTLAAGSCLWIRPDDPARTTITHYFVENGVEAIPPICGWSGLAPVEELGSASVGGTIVISKWHRQQQVLEAWQRLTRARRAPGPCLLVGSLERLLATSRGTHVRLRSSVTAIWRPGICCPSYEVSCETCVELKEPPSPLELSAREKLAMSLTRFVLCRLDDSNGPTNRATASLDQATMLLILGEQTFPGINAPKSEKDLLRMAVDWSSRPGRSEEAIKAVMGKIFLAGVPTRTLLHHDVGSGWGPLEVNPNNHTLRDQLLELAEKVPQVRDQLVAALEAQRMGTHTDGGLLRPCFSHAPPTFPSSEALYRIVADAASEMSSLRNRADIAETKLDDVWARLQRLHEVQISDSRDWRLGRMRDIIVTDLMAAMS